MSSQHQALKLLVQGDLVAVQPAAAKGPAADTLSVQLSSGEVSCGVLLDNPGGGGVGGASDSKAAGAGRLCGSTASSSKGTFSGDTVSPAEQWYGELLHAGRGGGVTAGCPGRQCSQQQQKGPGAETAEQWFCELWSLVEWRRGCATTGAGRPGGSAASSSKGTSGAHSIRPAEQWQDQLCDVARTKRRPSNWRGATWWQCSRGKSSREALSGKQQL